MNNNGVNNKNKLFLCIEIILVLIVLILGIMLVVMKKEYTNNRNMDLNFNSKISIDRFTKELKIDDEYKIKLNVNDKNINEKKIKWTSSNEEIVALKDCEKSACTISGLKEGESTIKAYYDGNNNSTIKIKVSQNKFIYLYKNEYKYMDNFKKNSYNISYYFDKDAKNISYEYKCENNDCETIGFSSHFVLINDNDNYIISTLNNNKEKVDMDFSKYKSVELVEKNNELIGYVFDEKNYYSIKDSKIKITVPKNAFFSYSDNMLNNNKMLINIIGDSKSYIYDISTGKPIKEFNDSFFDIYDLVIGGKKYYVFTSPTQDKSYNIFDNSFNTIQKDVKSLYIKDGAIYLVNTNKKVFGKYDNNFKLIKKSKEYDYVYKILNGYVLAEKNNDIILTDLNDKVINKFVTLTKTMNYQDYLSDICSKDGEEGIFITVLDTNLENTNNTTAVGNRYYYLFKSGKTGSYKTEIGGLGKPILYLYPKKDNTKVSITFNHPEYLGTTYPKYNGIWNVIVNKDGSIYDKNNKYYYALYWDENKIKKPDFKEGFYVTKDNAIDFLEDKLSKIGLNDRERNEFIMYWLPVLEKNNKSLVYFEFTESREVFNKININPKPDSLLRVAIHIKKVNSKVTIKEEKLHSFNRNGFTVVEWGGINY